MRVYFVDCIVIALIRVDEDLGIYGGRGNRLRGHWRLEMVSQTHSGPETVRTRFRSHRGGCSCRRLCSHCLLSESSFW